MRFTAAADTGAVLSMALSGLFDACKEQFRVIIGTKMKEIEMVPVSHDFDKGEDEALYLLKETNADILVSEGC